MKGRTFGILFLSAALLFGAALVWFQLFAFYERDNGPRSLTVAGQPVELRDYEGIDADSSPLRIRGCFRADADAFAAAQPAPDPTPLIAPFWFDCFDAVQLGEDLEQGRAQAFVIARDDPDGFDLHVAIYPDGRGYLWRQLNARFR